MKDIINTNKNIVFIGLPGCGKTSIGKEVADKLCLPFYDVDEYIEKKEGKLINNIFRQGEHFFRVLESKAIEEISKKCPSIISTGGGAVKISSNMEMLQKNSTIIFINRPVENIIKDIDISTRPLLKGDVIKIHNLYKERYHLYKKYSDIEVVNDVDFQEVVNRIVNIFK